MVHGVMAEERTFLSSEFSPMQPGDANAKSFSLSAGSTLTTRQSASTYGANGRVAETTVTIGEPSVASNGGDADRTHLLTEKIRKKKQGEWSAP